MSRPDEPNAAPSDVEAPSPTKPGGGGRGLEYALFCLGFACLAWVSYQAYRRYAFEPIDLQPTGEVMAGLQEVDRVPVESAAAKDYNLLVVTLDTVRADHLGCYGHPGVETQNIDKLARNGILFENAFTPSPSTLPGHSSIMTGLYPYAHEARANGTFKLGPEQVTLAEILKDRGYATGAVISSFVLDSRFGLDQGFDSYDDDLTKGVKWGVHMFRERPAEFTNEAAFEWLEANSGSKFFAWIHYFDAHAPYLPPEPFRSDYRRQPYDGEIAYVDSAIGRLVAKLEELGVRDNTVIVLAADHGEGLGEHGEASHSLLIYDSTLHTPLIINAPGLFSSGHVVRGQVSNVDIAPTALDLLGIPTPHDFDGTSLLQPSKQRPDSIYAETISTLVLHGWAPLFGIRRAEEKYILAPTPELYDLVEDPGELRNLFEERIADVAALSQVLDSHVGDDRYRKSAVVQVDEMEPEVAKKLAALGYVGSKAGGEIDVAAAAAFDPKDMVPHWENISQANNEIAGGNFQVGVDILEKALVEVPKDYYAIRCLAGAYLTMGKMADSEKLLLRAMELEKQDSGLYSALGRIYAHQRRFDIAEEMFAEALRIEPGDAAALTGRGMIAFGRRDREAAERYYRQAIEMDPGNTGPSAYVELGTIYLYALEFDKAREAFEESIRLDPLNAGAHNGLGSILVEEEKLDEARKEFALAARYNPNRPDILASLAMLYDKLHEYDKARALAERALGVNERSLRALNNLGLIMKHSGDMDKAMELFDRALEIKPGFLACRINLALCHAARNENEKAAGQLREVLKYNPNVPIALANLGAYHANHGRAELAARFFVRALRAHPQYALAHGHYGSLLLQMGRPDEALIHLKKSLEFEPDQQGHEQLEFQVDTLEQALRSTSQPATSAPSEAASP